MFLSSISAVLMLCALMLGSLLLVHLVQARQEQNLIRLYRLAALDRRRLTLIKLIQGLKALDDNPDVMRVLTQTLKHDLQRIARLDPARSNAEQELRNLGSGDTAKADKPAATNKTAKADQKTSLNNERDVIKARSLINDALSLIRHLYQVQQVSGEQLESTARHLGMLSAQVGVNSNIYMADSAWEKGDARKALGHYRAAESYLLGGPLKGAAGEQKLKYIQQRREQIVRESEDASQKFYANKAA